METDWGIAMGGGRREEEGRAQAGMQFLGVQEEKGWRGGFKGSAAFKQHSKWLCVNLH